MGDETCAVCFWSSAPCRKHRLRLVKTTAEIPGTPCSSCTFAGRPCRRHRRTVGSAS